MRLKTSKKIAIFAVIVMLLNLALPVMVKASSTSADFKGHLSMNNTKGYVGENVTVDIKVTSDMTIENGGLLLEYNKEKLQYVSSTTSTAIPTLTIMSNDTDDGVLLGLLYFGADPVTVPAGTVIASVTFQILDGGDQTLRLVYEQEDEHPLLAEATVDIDVPATGLTLDKNTLNLYTGEEGTTLTATVTPANTTDTLTWTSSNTSVATVVNGKVTPVGNGTATITAKVGTYTATCNVTVHTKLTDIKLNKTTAELFKGKTLDLTLEYVPTNADVMPDGSPIPATVWNSSNQEFATVNNGTVKGLKQGTTTITATVGTLTKQCEVSVKEVALDSIELNPSEDFELFLGDSKQLDVLVNPENTTDDVSNVVWESSAPDVVSVENGVVRALKIGEATITAKVNGKTASVKITVPEVLLEGIELKGDKTELKQGETTQLVVETNPSRVTEELNVKYTSSNPDVAKVDEETGLVTAVAPGTATITVVVNDEFEETLEITVTEEVYVPDAPEGDDDVHTPNTGDIAIELFIALMIVSALGIAFIIVKRNMKNK